MGRIRGMSFLLSGAVSLTKVLPANNPDTACQKETGRPTQSVLTVCISKPLNYNFASSLRFSAGISEITVFRIPQGPGWRKRCAGNRHFAFPDLIGC